MKHTLENRFYRILLKFMSYKATTGDAEKAKKMIEKFFISGDIGKIDYDDVELSMLGESLGDDGRIGLKALINHPIACIHAINGQMKIIERIKNGQVLAIQREKELELKNARLKKILKQEATRNV